MNEKRETRVRIDLTVKNHPGVMSHVCGLFSRRCFNVEGILCFPLDDGSISRIRLWTEEDERLDQLIKQAQKLKDVLNITCSGPDTDSFTRLQQLVA